MTACSSSAGRPHENALRSAHQCFSRSSSASGNPMNRNTVSPGSGKAKASMNSMGPPAAALASTMASISSPERRRTYGSSVCSRRREKPWRVLADAAVVGGLAIRHHLLRVEFGCSEDRLRLLTQREHRVLGNLRRVHVWLIEHVEDVGHLGDDDVAQLLGVEERAFVAQRAGDGVRIGQLVLVQWAPLMLTGSRKGPVGRLHGAGDSRRPWPDPTQPEIGKPLWWPRTCQS